MADYNKWTKDDLIARVKELENEAKIQNAGSLPAKHPEGPEPPSLADEPAKKKQKKKKGKADMDPNKYATRFIALKLAYLGKRYNGFEYQCSGLLSTIEEELWKALVKARLIFPDLEKPNEVDWNCCEYSKCGRTDRGVSAFGQVVALRVRSNKLAKGRSKQQQQQQQQQQVSGGAGKGDGGENVKVGGTPAAEETKPEVEKAVEEEEEEYDETPLPVEQEIQYCRILNRLLPPDIKIYAWCPSPPTDFSARFSCRERQYRYFFTQPAYQPLPSFLEPGNERTQKSTSDSNNRPKPKDGWLDIDAMRQAAKYFEGLNDFRNFCKVDASKQITNFTRRIFEADIVEVKGVDTEIPYLASPQFRDANYAGEDNGVAHPKVYYFHVRGSAFLWHQIRCMVAVLFLVGQGHEQPSVVAELLDTARHPQRPSYVLAEDTPLVLWDCIFGRENGEGAADEVDWLYVGEDSPLNLHGSWGVASELWEYWREKKMDEVLANRLLDWVATKTGADRVPSSEALERAGKTKLGTSTRVYEGGHGPRYVGDYVPVLKKDKLLSPEELNDRWAQRKGFNNAEEMRAVGNWRDAIREKKNGDNLHDPPPGQQPREHNNDILLPVHDNHQVIPDSEAPKRLVDQHVAYLLRRDEPRPRPPAREVAAPGRAGLYAQAAEHEERLGGVDAQGRQVEEGRAQGQEEVRRQCGGEALGGLAYGREVHGAEDVPGPFDHVPSRGERLVVVVVVAISIRKAVPIADKSAAFMDSSVVFVGKHDDQARSRGRVGRDGRGVCGAVRRERPCRVEEQQHGEAEEHAQQEEDGEEDPQ
ncbi:tRNA pseudouridine(38/39) synthase [Cytospora mali]|uniref:tRNA pseudouridine(38/39) synthase n=1 Tax=Cytospora mali TaxID=578113 RepID=A0A194VTY7_CYTMA|nr:tRNA pseudouridine(38/39) synthase [Valsa mali]